MNAKINLTEVLAKKLFIESCDIPDGWVQEHRFHKIRYWRFDFAWPEFKVAVEIEGGVWVKGRHNRGAGFIEDCHKYNEAARMGWTVLRFPTQEVENGTMIEYIVKHSRDLFFKIPF